MPAKVKLGSLLPHEFRQRLDQRPLAYLPLGTLEWHGEHSPLGADAIISEGLMTRCAEAYGGIVLPPIHLGPDRLRPDGEQGTLIGMDYANSTQPHRQLDGSCYWVSVGFFQTLIDHILTQVKRAGFTAVFADGHGPSRSWWVTGMRARERRFGLKLVGVTGSWAEQWASQMDHAGRNETSLLMALTKQVDLDQLPADRAIFPQGVGGEDPRDSTAEHGEACLRRSMALLEQMLNEAGA